MYGDEVGTLLKIEHFFPLTCKITKFVTYLNYSKFKGL